MPQKSKMWFYFKRVDDNTVSCNLCNKHIKSSGNTSNMMKHLNMHNKSTGTDKKDEEPKVQKLLTKRKKRTINRAFHNHWLDNIDNEVSHAGPSYEAEIEEKPLPVQINTPPAAIERISSYSDDDRSAQISDAILYFICADNQSFDIIQCKGFKHLMKELASLYRIPSKDTFKKRLDEKYDAVVQVFKKRLNEASHITITIDVWSETVSSRSYLGIAVHFIASGNRKLESGNIEVIELCEYTENYIACTLLNTLMKWGIDVSKVAAVVSNNEPNVVSAVTQTFGYDKYVSCFAHTINLVAENSLKNCEGLGSIVNKVRSVVKFVKNSANAINELHQRQVDAGTSENETKKLILDIRTRWNTTFYMIERFVELWNVINEVLFAKHETPEILTADELVTLTEILDLLKPFEFMARECSAESYIAMSKIIPLISCILTEYKKITPTMELSSKLKEVILAELDEKFGHIEFINLVSFATILDPRFKTIHFQNTQALSNAMYILRETINKSSVNSSGESDTEQKGTKYDLWIHHKLLAHKPKERNNEASLKDELSLYLASPLASLKDDPLEKWESMRMLYPSLYEVAIKYLSIVATSVPADRLFSKTEIATIQSRNRLGGKRLHKLLFLNSMDQEYWFQ